MPDPTAFTTILFTDIEGSSRLWETAGQRMGEALARHDALARDCVAAAGGTLVKTTGDGIHAIFADPRAAVAATVSLLRALQDPAATAGQPLKVRCGLHAGLVELRDGDCFGGEVNRAARIMGIAHGGQALASEVFANLLRERLPEGVTLEPLGAVRLRDLSHPERVLQIIHPGLPRAFPPLRSLESAPNNLPQQLTTFIGREREMQEVRALLETSRLVTLFGVGGLGKTRLSLQVAAEALPGFPDGVWFVELAPLHDPALVPQAVASVLGVREEPGRPVVEALVKVVRERQLLLILDNCEHLVGACTQLAKTLLQAGGGVRILASSREPLQLGGEAVYQVSPLAIPGVSEPLVAEAIEQYEAARLFVERVKAVRPEFHATDATARVIGEICTRLDGIPLAIELAAARTRSMSVESVAAHLDDRFALLTGGDRTALPRQQTLRALIDWSFDLLSEQERAAFRRLAVFAGGWTLEAAEQVVAGAPVERHQVLDRLTDLVDKSLVIYDLPTNRYRMLGTVREYARERLEAAGELPGLRGRHVACFASLLESAYEAFWGVEQTTWVQRLDLERENILAAHAACGRLEGGATTGINLVWHMKRYWIHRGLLGLGYRITEEAVGRLAESMRQERGRGLLALGELAAFMGRYREAEDHLKAALAIAQDRGDRETVASVLNTLSMTAMGCEDVAGARRYVSEGLAVARELGDERMIAAQLTALAQIERAEGRLDLAEPLYGEALERFRRLSDAESVAAVLLNLAMVALGLDSVAAGRSALAEALSIIDRIASSRLGECALDIAAGLAAIEGDFDRSARFFGVSEAEMASTGLSRDPADESFVRPLRERTRRSLGDEGFAAAAGSGRAKGYPATFAEARAWLQVGARDPALP
jgi:predicted ATPase/class 3 adenylate cyclase